MKLDILCWQWVCIKYWKSFRERLLRKIYPSIRPYILFLWLSRLVLLYDIREMIQMAENFELDRTSDNCTVSEKSRVQQEFYEVCSIHVKPMRNTFAVWTPPFVASYNLWIGKDKAYVIIFSFYQLKRFLFQIIVAFFRTSYNI